MPYKFCPSVITYEIFFCFEYMLFLKKYRGYEDYT